MWTADLNEIERKGTVRDKMKKKKKTWKGRRRTVGGKLRDKGMKYLLNVIISNHL